MKKITFIIPTRNNREYLKLCYQSIRNQLSKVKHDIVVLNDASNEGETDWMNKLKDENLYIIHNSTGQRKGIVHMFDQGIELAKTDIIFAFHADMIAGPNLDRNILKHVKKGTVVCATRIEPPLHPGGPEKIIQNFGLYPQDVNFGAVIDAIGYFEKTYKDKTTKGVFAPWCMYKDDYLSIGGHDPLFAPQSKEDSDLFNRFVLKDYNLIQSWDGLVYHFTCRGSRFSETSGGGVGKDSPEWKFTNEKSTKNFIRKWGHMVKHDPYMFPIIPPKYDICFVVKNSDISHLQILEPWCNSIHVDLKNNQIENYLKTEQPLTILNLSKKISNNFDNICGNIIVDIDGVTFNNQDYIIIQQLPEIIQQTNNIGTYKILNLTIRINDLTQYQTTLINVVK